jgi:hypothetical protein
VDDGRGGKPGDGAGVAVAKEEIPLVLPPWMAMRYVDLHVQDTGGRLILTGTGKCGRTLQARGYYGVDQRSRQSIFQEMCVVFWSADQNCVEEAMRHPTAAPTDGGNGGTGG